MYTYALTPFKRSVHLNAIFCFIYSYYTFNVCINIIMVYKVYFVFII